MELKLGDVHAGNQRGDEPQVGNGHDDSLPRGELEVATLLVGLAPKKKKDARQRHDQHEDEDEIRTVPGEPTEDGNAGQPEPWRKGGRNAAAIELADGNEIEEIQEVAGVGERDEERGIELLAQRVTDERAEGAQQGAANSDPGLNPRIAWRLLERDESTHERDEHRGAHFQAEMAGGDEMPALVDEEEDNEA